MNKVGQVLASSGEILVWNNQCELLWPYTPKIIETYAVISDIVPQDSAEYDMKYYSNLDQGGMIAYFSASPGLCSGIWVEGNGKDIEQQIEEYKVDMPGYIDSYLELDINAIENTAIAGRYYFTPTEEGISEKFNTACRYLPPRTAKSGYMIYYTKPQQFKDHYIELTNIYDTPDGSVYPEYSRILYYKGNPVIRGTGYPDYYYGNVLVNSAKYDSVNNVYCNDLFAHSGELNGGFGWLDTEVSGLSTNSISSEYSAISGKWSGVSSDSGSLGNSSAAASQYIVESSYLWIPSETFLVYTGNDCRMILR